MRFNLKFEMEKREIPLDYRGMIVSFIKSAFEDYNNEWFEKNYHTTEKGNDTTKKPFSFAVYLKNPKFLEDKIILEANDITVNFTTYSPEYGIHFFNSMLRKLHKTYTYRDEKVKLSAINMSKEKTIHMEKMLFKTLSPVVVRIHKKDGSKDEYLSWEDGRFAEQLKTNIYESAKEFFDFDIKSDVDEMKIEPTEMKKVLIAHFNSKAKMRIDGNIGKIAVEGKGYLLEWIYKAGAGSRKSQGFGMLEIV